MLVAATCMVWALLEPRQLYFGITGHAPSLAFMFQFAWVLLQLIVTGLLALVNLLAMLYYKRDLINERENTEERKKSDYHADLAVTYLLTTLLVALIGFSVCFGSGALVENIRHG